MAGHGFGIIGCGMIAEFHTRAINEIPGARVVAAYSRSRANAEKIAGIAQGPCQLYDDLDRMLAQPGLDVVCICTPSGAHLEPALQAARSGKHVVVEKPLEITLERCDAIIEACDAAGVRLCTIFPSRFTPANRRLKDAIQGGRFGRLTLGDTYVKWWRTQQYYDSGGWRGTWDLDGGGALMNQAIHNVDLLYWLMGDVESIMAQTATLAHVRIEVEDTAVACLRFRNGALGVIEAATSAYPGLLKRTEIHGDRGSARVEQDDITLWEFQEKVPSDNEVFAAMAAASGFKAGASDPRGISHIGIATSWPISSRRSTPAPPHSSTAARAASRSRSSARFISPRGRARSFSSPSMPAPAEPEHATPAGAQIPLARDQAPRL